MSAEVIAHALLNAKIADHHGHIWTVISRTAASEPGLPPTYAYELVTDGQALVFDARGVPSVVSRQRTVIVSHDDLIENYDPA